MCKFRTHLRANKPLIFALEFMHNFFKEKLMQINVYMYVNRHFFEKRSSNVIV